MPRIADYAEPTGAQKTEALRRRARHRFAMDRAAKMADGVPRFTDEELAELAGVFLSRVTAAQQEPAA